MSIFYNICCSRCGRELYRPLNVPECREGQAFHFPGLYVVNDNGQKEYCEKCFEAWKRNKAESEEV